MVYSFAQESTSCYEEWGMCTHIGSALHVCKHSIVVRYTHTSAFVKRDLSGEERSKNESFMNKTITQTAGSLNGSSSANLQCCKPNHRIVSLSFSVRKPKHSFSLHHMLDDLSAGVNTGEFSTMGSAKALTGVSLESPIACHSFSASCTGRPTPPGYYGGVTLSGPPTQMLVWKPQACTTTCISARK